MTAIGVGIVKQAQPVAPTVQERLMDAALRCVARWGVSKTTVEDVAREAGYSRATLYRAVPGGKDRLLEAAADAEIARFFAAIAAELQRADTLEDALVGGMAEAGRRIRDHAALQYLLAHEPELVLPRLAFAQLDAVLAAAGAFVAPWLERWLTPEDARRAGEWVTRLVVSYSCTPGDVDIADPSSVRQLVRAFVLPGLIDRRS